MQAILHHFRIPPKNPALGFRLWGVGLRGLGYRGARYAMQVWHAPAESNPKAYVLGFGACTMGC